MARAANQLLRASPLIAVRGRLTLHVRVTPRSRHDSVASLADTIDGPAVSVHVRAVPEDGAANAAVIATVAEWLGVPKTSIALSAGGKSRYKALDIGWADPAIAATLLAKLEDLTSDGPTTCPPVT